MADTKLFNIKGAVKEYQSGTVTLEKELQTVIENNMNIFFGVTFLASEYRTTDGGRMDSISPAKSAIKWKEVMPLFENDIDFSIAVLCNPTIASQLHIIGDDTEHLIANAWNSQWDCVLLGALFNHNAMCNLQSDQPIEQIAKAEYIHITNYELRALLSDIYNISEEDELWLEKYYKTAYKLLEKDSFQTAVHTMASYRWHSVPRVQLAVIWSGIESLFNVNTEVSFRISLYIANFLGENEAQAQQIFKQVRKMYSSRSSAVHGNKTKDNLESAVEESANLLTRILRRCAELNKLPDVDNLAFRVDKQTKARH